MSFIGTGLNAFLNAFGAGQGDLGPGPLTKDDLAGTLEDIKFGFTIIRDTFDAADSAANAAVTAATDAAGQAEKIGQNVKDITRRTVDIILPHSMQWLEGHIVSTWIVPIRHRLNQDETRLGILEGFRRSTDTWRYKYVDPHIKDYIAFRKFFDGWPRDVLLTWHDWFQHPAKFGQWAAAPLAGPLIAYLAAQNHKEARDSLALVMTGAWAEEPDAIWQRVTEWLVK